MSLKGLLDLSESRTLKKQGMSEERLKAQLPHLRNLIAYYREYPDFLVDFMKGLLNSFFIREYF